MKKQATFLILFSMLLSGSLPLQAQKKERKITYKEARCTLDNQWKVEKKTTPQGDYSLVCTRDSMDRFEIHCINDKVNLQNTLFAKTGQLKKEPNMDYMSLDEEENVTFQKRDALQIVIHNQYLTDFYRGAFLAFHDTGRTFVVFWYTRDLPEKLKNMAQIVENVKILH